jgi:hypothetical protein
VRIAVVGAGIFGCTAAIELARAGHRVEVFERHSDLMMGASRANQGRLHRGYHYPRSPETARAASAEADRFGARFPSAIRDGAHYYAIAAYDSLTTTTEFMAFCRDQVLPLTRDWPAFLHGVESCFRVPESLIDLDELRELLRRELKEAGVGVFFDASASHPMESRGAGDLVVNATYGHPSLWPVKYEDTEIALFRLPLPPVSVVVMDGPFISLDPTSTPGVFMVYGVQESIAGSPATILARARKFLTLGKAQYVGSLKTTRAVLTSAEATDARPTLVRRDGNVISILAGKIGTALEAADRVVAEITEMAAVA